MKIKTFLPVLLILMPALVVSCSRDARERERIAVVNGAPIYLDEFHREVAIASEREPAFSVNRGSLKATLEKMVEKRLLIQEARRKGITEDERFIAAIKAFWEQTLIQRLIEELNKELAESIYVTEAEVKRHYDRMGSKMTLLVKGSAGEEAALEVKRALEAGVAVKGAETIGPVLIEEIQPSSPLAAAFDLAPGAAAVYRDPSGGPDAFVTALVVKKEREGIKPLSELSRHIRAELLERKRQQALSGWLDGVKGGATVEIDGKLLERIADE